MNRVFARCKAEAGLLRSGRRSRGQDCRSHGAQAAPGGALPSSPIASLSAPPPPSQGLSGSLQADPAPCPRDLLDCVDFQCVDGIGELPGAPGAAAELAEDSPGPE